MSDSDAEIIKKKAADFERKTWIWRLKDDSRTT